MGNLLLPDLIVQLLFFFFLPQLTVLVQLIFGNLIVEFLLLANERFDFLGQVVFDEIYLIVLATGEYGILFEQTERVHALC